ncbi:hypothetical protein FHX75_111345 [Micromonospora palomenae]|uniref:Uncharacterized protein n=1 Tax=Micromonospora palomenae TaxID=1461247 RepID=A0A561WWF3_9ACTN|nr:hypothetical protein [Micromonospora palomenae]TWG28194.1 hypothetical protein FHX75_111345 [Micromonospora palomenae]
MSFRTESTLAGYARAAVDLRLRMTEYSRSRFAQQYLRAFLEPRLAHDPDYPARHSDVLGAFTRVAHEPWQHGEPYVLAPAMTAIIAAAAQALDLTGDVVGNDIAPSDAGVLFLPTAGRQSTGSSSPSTRPPRRPDRIGGTRWAARNRAPGPSLADPHHRRT